MKPTAKTEKFDFSGRPRRRHSRKWSEYARLNKEGRNFVIKTFAKEQKVTAGKRFYPFALEQAGTGSKQVL